MALPAHRPKGLATLEMRSAPRFRVFVTRAGLGHGDETPEEAALIDISIYGCKLGLKSTVMPGTRVTIVLESANPVAATVIWNDVGKIGCRFEEPIERSLLRAINLRQP